MALKAQLPENNLQLLLQNDHTPFLVGQREWAAATDCWGEAKKEAFKHIANKKQTDKMVRVGIVAQILSRTELNGRRVRCQVGVGGAIKAKVSKTVSGNARTRPKTAVASKRKKLASKK